MKQYCPVATVRCLSSYKRLSELKFSENLPYFIAGRPSNDPLNQDFVPTLFQQKEIDSRKRKHAKIKLAAKTNHQTAQVDDLLSEMLKEQDRDNKMVKEETVDIKVESGTKQADTKNSCLQQQVDK